MSTTVKEQKINLIDFFPDCVLPHCEQQGEAHQHILPHQQDILDCTTKYLYCQGGVGSAKSLAFAVKCVYLSMILPENIGIVSRVDYKLLYKSSWREIKACIRRLVYKGYIDPDFYQKKMFRDKKQGDYSTINFPNGSILYAVQSKNLNEALGSSYGLFWVDDAQESMEEYFIGDNTSAGLLSRLRLPHIHFDRRTYSLEGRRHGSLHGMVSSNPPPYSHWLHKLFGDKPGIHHIGDDEVTWMMVSTHDNPFVGEDYGKGLVAVQHKMGHNTNTVRRVIYGESIPAYKGIPVFPQFKHALHVAPLKFRPDLPLIRSWDFGYLHPAVLYANLYKCPYRTNHYFALSEITDAANVNVHTLYKKYVIPHTQALYSNATLIRDCGDRSGFRQSSSNRDSRSDMKILINEYNLPFKHGYFHLTPSLQYMRGLLEPKTPCQCGLPLTLIGDKCRTLIGALEGGYHFPHSRSGIVGDKPVEDRFFADIACAWRYGAENYVKWGLPFEDQQEMKQTHRSQFSVQRHDNTNLEWLNEADKAMMKRITG